MKMLNFSGFFDDANLVDVTPSKQTKKDKIFESAMFDATPGAKNNLFDSMHVMKPLLKVGDVPEDLQREITRKVREEIWFLIQQEIEKIRADCANQINKIRQEMLSQNSTDVEKQVAQQVEQILAAERLKMEAEYKRQIEVLCVRAVKETETRLKKDFEQQINQIQRDILKRLEFSTKSLGTSEEHSSHLYANLPSQIQSQSILQSTLSSEFNAQDFAEQLIQQARVGSNFLNDTNQNSNNYCQQYSQQYNPYQEQRFDQSLYPTFSQFGTAVPSYNHQKCQKSQFVDIEHEIDAEEEAEDEEGEELIKSVEHEPQSIPQTQTKRQEQTTKKGAQQVRFHKVQKEVPQITSEPNNNKENEVIMNGNRYQELLLQQAKKGTTTKKPKSVVVSNSSCSEDELLKVESSIDAWRKVEKEHGEKFREQQGILEEYFRVEGEMAPIVSRVKNLLNWVYNMWNNLEISYQARHMFVSAHIMQPILSSDLSLNADNIQLIEENLTREANSLNPLLTSMFKEMAMVVRREEVKRKLEEMRIEMEQYKNKLSPQFKKLATESTNLRLELKQLSKQLTITLQQWEKNTQSEFTYRGFRYANILSYEKLRQEQENLEAQKKEVQKKAQRTR